MGLLKTESAWCQINGSFGIIIILLLLLIVHLLSLGILSKHYLGDEKVLRVIDTLHPPHLPDGSWSLVHNLYVARHEVAESVLARQFL